MGLNNMFEFFLQLIPSLEHNSLSTILVVAAILVVLIAILGRTPFAQPGQPAPQLSGGQRTLLAALSLALVISGCTVAYLSEPLGPHYGASIWHRFHKRTSCC